MMERSVRIGRLVLTVGLMLAIFAFTDTGRVIDQIRLISVSVLALAVILLLVSQVLGALRLHAMLRAFAIPHAS
jgi:hypothetical protein